ncbi:MAG TPA: arginine deiminase family protein [Bryobacteraceae bacterium]|jgi:dimethylargininase|nr:arginine deiminase family protein [Bryobacteraceae bacterium]
MLRALTRQVSPSFASCELTFLDRQPIDVAKAMEQHRAYEACLTGLGVKVISLPAEPNFPDGVFVEDPAIVLDEVAIITRPGAESRRGETESVAQALSPFRDLRYIREPGTLEGGDVLTVGRTLYVGLSRRTNRLGIGELADVVDLFGYRVVPVEVTGCLHLKSGACWAGGDVILANPKWIDAAQFRNFRIIEVPEDEPSAADVLPIGDALLVPANFPHTRQILEGEGIKVRTIDVSELQKAEAGVTCMSLLFETQG